ncbi:uncharacterized protein RAG0_11555 [Rhynchosporium agropyri]|uniref:Uncharacterized protein n=1 Tax=Rhynchosporium agropyri TaxID=914238 RepID=A0A1E1L4K8_9HELO|nr:uncharacterized protein RAG0_11555 [Rhynchosporium agropyri]
MSFAPGPGRGSSTHTLTDTLRLRKKSGKPSTISQLHATMLARTRGVTNPYFVSTPAPNTKGPERSVLLTLPMKIVNAEPLGRQSEQELILSATFRIFDGLQEKDAVWQDWIMKAPPGACVFHQLHVGIIPSGHLTD